MHRTAPGDPNETRPGLRVALTDADADETG